MQGIRINSLALIKNDSRILVQTGYDKNKNQSFLRLLGGGVEFGETAEQALHREFTEELGCALQNVRFLQIYENIFEYQGEKKHEITFLFSADVEEKITKVDKIKILDSKTEKYAEWVSVDVIKKEGVRVFPEVVVGWL
jgi:ADP-ribose pyrophosphatase YjhB (NUDIX family)